MMMARKNALLLYSALWSCALAPAAATPIFDPSHAFTPAELAFVLPDISTIKLGSGTLKIMKFEYSEENGPLIHNRRPLIVFSFNNGDIDDSMPSGAFFGSPHCQYKLSFDKMKGGYFYKITPLASTKCHDTEGGIEFSAGKIMVNGNVIGSYL